MIRLTDPKNIGPALASVRDMLGLSRRRTARRIAEATGRTETSVNAQLWTWDVGPEQATTGRRPDVASLGPYLDVLDFDLALVSRSEDPKRQRTLLAAIDNALRNGSHMTGANLALDLLCEELGVDREELAFDSRWAQKEQSNG